ncbi:helix-turn-helix domain-containing protein [Microbacterium sp. X-17]|uniref:ArsR/SmtB family transcription factor n=1 Tax=Microbacterium sp. X-17 TaxID=3144404 RepID=UPI0031F4BA8F
MVYVQESVSEAELDAVFAALAHPVRRDLLRFLATRGAPMRMSAIAAARGISPQLLNKHVASLEKAGLAARRRSGREKDLVIDADRLALAQTWLLETRRFWETRLDSLDAYIAELGMRRDDEGAD